MEFFNKKQDVLELKLTQFGRNLLSRGALKPVYYAFFDDNVLYNSERSGVSELQNISQQRIKETQTMRAQTGFSSLEREFDLLYEQFFEEAGGAPGHVYETIQKSAEKNYLLPSPLGTMAEDSSHMPAWNVTFLNGQISSSADTFSLVEKTGGSVVLNIPQITAKMEVDIQDKIAYTPSPGDPVFEGQAIFTEAGKLFFLIKINEENTPFQKKNFDMEMFEIEETIEDGETIETLRSLSFASVDPSNMEVVGEVAPTFTQKYADYYFDIKVDSDIGDKLICQYDTTKENKSRSGVFTSGDERPCEDVLREDPDRTFDIYEDEEDYPGEIC